MGVPEMNGHRMGERGQDGDPEEHRPQDGAHQHQRGPGVLAWGSRKMLTPLEMASVPVMAELAVGEGAQEIEGRDAEDQATARRGRGACLRGSGARGRGAHGLLDEAGDDQHRHVGDEEIGREAKTFPASRMPRRLPKARSTTKTIESGTASCPRRDGRNDGVRPGGHRDGHRDGVADEQRRPGHLGHVGTEVVPAHDVGATGLGIRADDVAIADRDDGQHGQDGAGDRRDQGEGDEPGDRDEDAEDLLGGVGRRRHHVRREDRQCGRLAQALAMQLIVHQRRAQEEPLDPVIQLFGKLGRLDRRRRPGAFVRLGCGRVICLQRCPWRSRLRSSPIVYPDMAKNARLGLLFLVPSSRGGEIPATQPCRSTRAHKWSTPSAGDPAIFPADTRNGCIRPHGGRRSPGNGRAADNPERHGAGCALTAAAGLWSCHVATAPAGAASLSSMVKTETRAVISRILSTDCDGLRISTVPPSARARLWAMTRTDRPVESMKLQVGQIEDDLRLSLFGQRDEAVSQLRRSGQVQLALHRDDDTAVRPTRADMEGKCWNRKLSEDMRCASQSVGSESS